MRANPGGQIAPNEIIGRDMLTARLWEVLEKQSVVLVAERRMGKSCVLKKMLNEQPEGHLVFCRDVESISSPIAFAKQVYSDVRKHLGRVKRTEEGFWSLLERLGGTEVKGVLKLPATAGPQWREFLQGTLKGW